MIYQKHEIYSFIDGDNVDVIFKGTDTKRLDRFNDYITIGMCMALPENDDLLMELLGRLDNGGARNE